MNRAQPTAEAVAISAGRIIAVGSESDLEGLVVPGTDVTQVGAGVIIPGLVEPHMHLWSTALFEKLLDCSPFANPDFESVVELIRRTAATTPDGDLIVGQRFDGAAYEGLPILTRDLLDSLAPRNPVTIISGSMHFIYCNAAAFALAGIDAQTADPPGGSYWREDGKLVGVCAEMPAMTPLLATMIPEPTAESIGESVAAITARFAACGVTSIRDAGTGALLGMQELAILHSLRDSDQLSTRVTVAWLETQRQLAIDGGLKAGDGDDWVRAVAWKLMGDGSLMGKTAFQREPYVNSTIFGEPNYTPSDLESAIRRAHKEGWQVMIHAAGDGAVEMAVTAYEHVLGAAQTNDRRHRIEHCGVADAELFRRMAAAGVTPSFLEAYLYYWGDTFRDDILGPERSQQICAAATAIEAGARTTMHSDYTVSPIAPFRDVQTAVTRQTESGSVLNPSERVSVQQALEMVTINAAWQNHVDHIVGSIQPGKYADVAVLDANPFNVDPESLAEIAVNQTIVDGRTR